MIARIIKDELYPYYRVFTVPDVIAHEIPDELYQRHLKAVEEFLVVQELLSKIERKK